MYKLELYSDNKFLLHVPTNDYSGKYRIAGDTIFLNYDKDTVGTGYAPIAYLISLDKKKIDELEFDGQSYQIRSQNNRWIQIIEYKLNMEM